MPLTSLLFLARFFRQLFQRFLHTRDDGESDKHTQHIAEQVSHLPQGVEPTKCTMLLAVDGDTSKPVLGVVCRSTALPNDQRSSHDMAPMSATSHSQAGSAFETDLNPSNGYSPLNGSRISSITPSSIQGYLSASSNLSQLSQGISSTTYNLAADAHLNSSDVHLPHTGPAPSQGWLLSNSKAEAVPQLLTSAQCDGQNQADVAEFMLHDVYPHIMAIAPEPDSIFWDRPRKTYRNPDGFVIAPLTTSFFLRGVPNGWLMNVHPQGFRYYIHEMMIHASPKTSLTPHDSLLRVFTDADVIVPEDLRILTDFLDNIVNYVCVKGIILPPQVDLFLGLRPSPESPVCAYYFADHAHRSIFWLDDFDARTLSIDGVITTESSHLAHVIETGYWTHLSFFPACQEMTSDTVEEVNDFLLYCITETTETTSTAQYGFTLSELQQYLTVVSNIRSNPRSYSYPGSVYTVAWLLGHRSHDRYIHFHGEPGARRGSRHKPETVERSHMPLIVLLSPLLFFAPDVHCTTLYRVWDNGVAKADWIALVRKLSTEWQEFVINATVLLNANVAFLAIQSIDESSIDKGRSPTQIASYVSTILSVGSIILGLLLLQKYRHKNRVYSTLLTEFLGIQQGDLGRRLGIETLAIMYSLPWALLMWAMNFFLAAFCLMCFTASSLSVRMIVGSALLVIAIVIFWYLTVSRERYEQRWYVQMYARLVKTWILLPRRLSAHFPAKFNSRMGSNDVEMALMGSHTTASLDNDALMSRRHRQEYCRNKVVSRE